MQHAESSGIGQTSSSSTTVQPSALLRQNVSQLSDLGNGDVIHSVKSLQVENVSAETKTRRSQTGFVFIELG